MTTICINKDQHANRQRFTMAHEIGHHVLRHLLAGEHVHVDRVIMRNAVSSEGTDAREIEANQFAASLRSSPSSSKSASRQWHFV